VYTLSAGTLCCAYRITACPLEFSEQSEDATLEAVRADCGIVKNCGLHLSFQSQLVVMSEGARCNDWH
jgi:hypothetical protein